MLCFFSHKGTKGTKVFWVLLGFLKPQRTQRFFGGTARVYLTQSRRDAEFFWGGMAPVASRGSRVNLSYCDHAVARNLESKSAARFFHAKARRHEAWRASVPTSRFLSRDAVARWRAKAVPRSAHSAALVTALQILHTQTY